MKANVHLCHSHPLPRGSSGHEGLAGLGSLSAASVSSVMLVIISSEGPLASSGHGSKPCWQWSLFPAIGRAGGRDLEHWTLRNVGDRRWYQNIMSTVWLHLPFTTNDSARPWVEPVLWLRCLSEGLTFIYPLVHRTKLGAGWGHPCFTDVEIEVQR